MPVDHSNNFKIDEKYIQSLSGGYVNEAEVPITMITELMAVNCNNVDIENNMKIREPYDIHSDLENVLPSGYEIIRFAEKNFTDAAGNNQKVLIVCAKGSSLTSPESEKLRIYANYYYLPESSYENAWKNGSYISGWQSGWYELTERYSGKATAGSIEFIANLSYSSTGFPPIAGVIYNLKSTSTKLNKDRDYFKGWFVSDNNGEMCGIVTGSIWYNGAAYFKTKITAGAPISNQWSINRFPVNQFNQNVWKNINKVDINIENPNVVRFYFNDKSENIWLGYISDRAHFGGWRALLPIYSGTPTNWLTVTDIHYTETISKTYKIKCAGILNYTGYKKIQFAYTDNNFVTTKYFQAITANVLGNFSFESLMLDGITIKVTGNVNYFTVNTSLATLIIDKSEVQTKWNGLWMRKDPPHISNKLFFQKYESNDPKTDVVSPESFSKELGISYGVQSYKIRFEAAPFNYRIYSLAIELDGSQAIFIKNLLTTIHNEPGTGVFHGSLTIDLYFEYWFDRSITAHLLFLGTDDGLQGNLSAKRILNTGRLLVNTKIEGYYPIGEMPVTIDEDKNMLKVNLITSQGGPGATEHDLYPEEHATGETLQGYLNNFYYSDINVKPQLAAKVGENIIGVNLKYDKIDATKVNPETQKNPKTMMCLSQFQREAVHTESILCTERIKQASKGGEIIAIAGTIGQQFLIFTNNECRWLEVLDSKNFTIKTQGIFDDKGAISTEAVVKAVNVLQTQTGPTNAPVSSEFEGVFYFSSNTAFGFYNNQPVDLFDVKDSSGRKLYSTWKEEYQNLSDEIKENIKGGYLFNKREVWWQVGNKIRIWSIPHKEWKNYTLNDTVIQFLQEEDGELYFCTARKIYKTEKEGTTKWKDRQSSSSPAYINWELEILLTHGNISQSKAPGGVEINFTAEGDSTGRDYPMIKVQAGTFESRTNLLDRRVIVMQNGTALRYFKHKEFDQRLRCGYWRLKISSDTASLPILRKFKILLIKIHSYLSRGTLTTQ